MSILNENINKRVDKISINKHHVLLKSYYNKIINSKDFKETIDLKRFVLSPIFNEEEVTEIRLLCTNCGTAHTLPTTNKKDILSKITEIQDECSGECRFCKEKHLLSSQIPTSHSEKNSIGFNSINESYFSDNDIALISNSLNFYINQCLDEVIQVKAKNLLAKIDYLYLIEDDEDCFLF